MDVKMLGRVACHPDEHCTNFRARLEQTQCMKQFHLPPCVRIFPFEIQSYICQLAFDFQDIEESCHIRTQIEGVNNSGSICVCHLTQFLTYCTQMTKLWRGCEPSKCFTFWLWGGLPSSRGNISIKNLCNSLYIPWDELDNYIKRSGR